MHYCFDSSSSDEEDVSGIVSPVAAGKGSFELLVIFHDLYYYYYYYVPRDNYDYNYMRAMCILYIFMVDDHYHL